MKTQESIENINQISNQQVSTTAPNGNTVDGFSGAFVNFSHAEYVADSEDHDAHTILRRLLNLSAILAEHNPRDVTKPITRLPLPENRLTKSNLDNALWLGNAVLAKAKNLSIVDLTQSKALSHAGFGMQLLESDPEWIIAVESERTHIPREERRDMNTVKRMLTAVGGVTALSVATNSVSLIEKHVAYAEGTVGNYGELYMAA